MHCLTDDVAGQIAILRPVLTSPSAPAHGPRDYAAHLERVYGKALAVARAVLRCAPDPERET